MFQCIQGFSAVSIYWSFLKQTCDCRSQSLAVASLRALSVICAGLVRPLAAIAALWQLALTHDGATKGTPFPLSKLLDASVAIDHNIYGVKSQDCSYLWSRPLQLESGCPHDHNDIYVHALWKLHFADDVHVRNSAIKVLKKWHQSSSRAMIVYCAPLIIMTAWGQCVYPQKQGVNPLSYGYHEFRI